MAVSLPTAADVRKVREQAAKTAAERAEVARTPLLAVLGAGDYAVSTLTSAVTTARTKAAERAEQASELPGKFKAEEVRKVIDDVRAQVEKAYGDFAERGEKAWGKFRAQPQVKQAVSTISSYSGKFEARVDEFVDTSHDVAEKTLTTVTKQTRSTGEKVAQATQRFTGQAAAKVTEASKDASEAVAEAGTKTAAAIDEAGAEAASTTRSTARKTANRTAVKK